MRNPLVSPIAQQKAEAAKANAKLFRNLSLFSLIGLAACSSDSATTDTPTPTDPVAGATTVTVTVSEDSTQSLTAETESTQGSVDRDTDATTAGVQLVATQGTNVLKFDSVNAAQLATVQNAAGEEIATSVIVDMDGAATMSFETTSQQRVSVITNTSTFATTSNSSDTEFLKPKSYDLDDNVGAIEIELDNNKFNAEFVEAVNQDGVKLVANFDGTTYRIETDGATKVTLRDKRVEALTEDGIANAAGSALKVDFEVLRGTDVSSVAAVEGIVLRKDAEGNAVLRIKYNTELAEGGHIAGSITVREDGGTINAMSVRRAADDATVAVVTLEEKAADLRGMDVGVRVAEGALKFADAKVIGGAIGFGANSDLGLAERFIEVPNQITDVSKVNATSIKGATDVDIQPIAMKYTQSVDGGLYDTVMIELNRAPEGVAASDDLKEAFEVIINGRSSTGTSTAAPEVESVTVDGKMVEVKLAEGFDFPPTSTEVKYAPTGTKDLVEGTTKIEEISAKLEAEFAVDSARYVASGNMLEVTFVNALSELPDLPLNEPFPLNFGGIDYMVTFGGIMQHPTRSDRAQLNITEILDDSGNSLTTPLLDGAEAIIPHEFAQPVFDGGAREGTVQTEEIFMHFDEEISIADLEAAREAFTVAITQNAGDTPMDVAPVAVELLNPHTLRLKVAENLVGAESVDVKFEAGPTGSPIVDRDGAAVMVEDQTVYESAAGTNKDDDAPTVASVRATNDGEFVQMVDEDRAKDSDFQRGLRDNKSVRDVVRGEDDADGPRQVESVTYEGVGVIELAFEEGINIVDDLAGRELEDSFDIMVTRGAETFEYAAADIRIEYGTTMMFSLIDENGVYQYLEATDEIVIEYTKDAEYYIEDYAGNEWEDFTFDFAHAPTDIDAINDIYDQFVAIESEYDITAATDGLTWEVETGEDDVEAYYVFLENDQLIVMDMNDDPITEDDIIDFVLEATDAQQIDEEGGFLTFQETGLEANTDYRVAIVYVDRDYNFYGTIEDFSTRAEGLDIFADRGRADASGNDVGLSEIVGITEETEVELFDGATGATGATGAVTLAKIEVALNETVTEKLTLDNLEGELGLRLKQEYESEEYMLEIIGVEHVAGEDKVKLSVYAHDIDYADKLIVEVDGTDADNRKVLDLNDNANAAKDGRAAQPIAVSIANDDGTGKGIVTVYFDAGVVTFLDIADLTALAPRLEIVTQRLTATGQLEEGILSLANGSKSDANDEVKFELKDANGGNVLVDADTAYSVRPKHDPSNATFSGATIRIPETEHFIQNESGGTYIVGSEEVEDAGGNPTGEREIEFSQAIDQDKVRFYDLNSDTPDEEFRLGGGQDKYEGLVTHDENGTDGDKFAFDYEQLADEDGEYQIGVDYTGDGLIDAIVEWEGEGKYGLQDLHKRGETDLDAKWTKADLMTAYGDEIAEAFEDSRLGYVELDLDDNISATGYFVVETELSTMHVNVDGIDYEAVAAYVVGDGTVQVAVGREIKENSYVSFNYDAGYGIDPLNLESDRYDFNVDREPGIGEVSVDGYFDWYGDYRYEARFEYDRDVTTFFTVVDADALPMDLDKNVINDVFADELLELLIEEGDVFEHDEGGEDIIIDPDEAGLWLGDRVLVAVHVDVDNPEEYVIDYKHIDRIDYAPELENEDFAFEFVAGDTSVSESVRIYDVGGGLALTNADLTFTGVTGLVATVAGGGVQTDAEGEQYVDIMVTGTPTAGFAGKGSLEINVTDAEGTHTLSVDIYVDGSGNNQSSHAFALTSLFAGAAEVDYVDFAYDLITGDFIYLDEEDDAPVGENVMLKVPYVGTDGIVYYMPSGVAPTTEFVRFGEEYLDELGNYVVADVNDAGVFGFIEAPVTIQALPTNSLVVGDATYTITSNKIDEFTTYIDVQRVDQDDQGNDKLVDIVTAAEIIINPAGLIEWIDPQLIKALLDELGLSVSSPVAADSSATGLSAITATLDRMVNGETITQDLTLFADATGSLTLNLSSEVIDYTATVDPYSGSVWYSGVDLKDSDSIAPYVEFAADGTPSYIFIELDEYGTINYVDSVGNPIDDDLVYEVAGDYYDQIDYVEENTVFGTEAFITVEVDTTVTSVYAFVTDTDFRPMGNFGGEAMRGAVVRDLLFSPEVLHSDSVTPATENGVTEVTIELNEYLGLFDGRHKLWLVAEDGSGNLSLYNDGFAGHIRPVFVEPLVYSDIELEDISYEYVADADSAYGYIDVVFDFNHDLEEFGAENFDIETDDMRTEFDEFFAIESITKDENEEGKYTVRVEVLEERTDEELKIDGVRVREEGAEYFEEFDPKYFHDEGIDTEYVFDSDGLSLQGPFVEFAQTQDHAGLPKNIIDVTYVLDGEIDPDSISADDFLVTKTGEQGEAPILATYLEQPNAAGEMEHRIWVRFEGEAGATYELSFASDADVTSAAGDALVYDSYAIDVSLPGSSGDALAADAEIAIIEDTDDSTPAMVEDDSADAERDASGNFTGNLILKLVFDDAIAGYDEDGDLELDASIVTGAFDISEASQTDSSGKNTVVSSATVESVNVSSFGYGNVLLLEISGFDINSEEVQFDLDLKSNITDGDGNTILATDDLVDDFTW